MKYIYLAISLIIIYRVIKRKFDFLSLGAVTYLAYTSYCIGGTVYIIGGSTGYYYKSSITAFTYLCIIIQELIILSFLLKKNHINANNLFETSMKKTDIGLFWDMLLIFCVVCFAYTIIYKIGVSAFFSYTRKTDLRGQIGIGYSLSIWGSLLCLVHFLQNRRWVGTILSFSLVLLTLIQGGRAYFATAVITVLLINQRKIKRVVQSNYKIVSIGSLGVIFLILYKKVFRAVRALDWERVFSILCSFDTYSDLLEIDEWRTNLALYNYILDSRFHLSIRDSLARLFSIIPFFDNLLTTSVPIRMSTIIQRDIFNSSYGLANSFWAELYAMGKVPLLIIGTVIWLSVLKHFSVAFSQNYSVKPFSTIGTIYCGFYIHRLDFVQIIGCIKSILLFYFLWLFFIMLRNKGVTLEMHNYTPNSSTSFSSE